MGPGHLWAQALLIWDRTIYGTAPFMGPGPLWDRALMGLGPLWDWTLMGLEVFFFHFRTSLLARGGREPDPEGMQVDFELHGRGEDGSGSHAT